MLRDQLIAAGRPDLAKALATGGGGVDSGAADLPGVDQDLLDRVEAVRRKGDPVAIFVGPATDPDDPRPPWLAGVDERRLGQLDAASGLDRRGRTVD